MVTGAPTVNPQQTGTKCAFWYSLTVRPEETATIRLNRALAREDMGDLNGAYADYAQAAKLAMEQAYLNLRYAMGLGPITDDLPRVGKAKRATN